MLQLQFLMYSFIFTEPFYTKHLSSEHKVITRVSSCKVYYLNELKSLLEKCIYGKTSHNIISTGILQFGKWQLNMDAMSKWIKMYLSIFVYFLLVFDEILLHFGFNHNFSCVLAVACHCSHCQSLIIIVIITTPFHSVLKGQLSDSSLPDTALSS